MQDIINRRGSSDSENGSANGEGGPVRRNRGGAPILWQVLLSLLMDPNFDPHIRWTGNGLEFVIERRCVVFAEWRMRKAGGAATTEDPWLRWKGDLATADKMKSAERGLRGYYARNAKGKIILEKREGMTYGYYFTNRQEVLDYLGISREMLEERIKEVAARHEYPQTTNGSQRSNPGTPSRKTSTSQNFQCIPNPYAPTANLNTTLTYPESLWNDTYELGYDQPSTSRVCLNPPLEQNYSFCSAFDQPLTSQICPTNTPNLDPQNSESHYSIPNTELPSTSRNSFIPQSPQYFDLDLGYDEPSTSQMDIPNRPTLYPQNGENQYFAPANDQPSTSQVAVTHNNYQPLNDSEMASVPSISFYQSLQFTSFRDAQSPFSMAPCNSIASTPYDSARGAPASPEAVPDAMNVDVTDAQSVSDDRAHTIPNQIVSELLGSDPNEELMQLTVPPNIIDDGSRSPSENQIFNSLLDYFDEHEEENPTNLNL